MATPLLDFKTLGLRGHVSILESAGPISVWNVRDSQCTYNLYKPYDDTSYPHSQPTH